MHTGVRSIAYFGKLPAHGDFVRRNAGGASVRAMDQWLQRGLYLARTKLNQQLDAAYDGTLPCAFYYNPRDTGQALIGVMRASRDRVGRKFPFVIAFEAEDGNYDARRMPGIPVQFDSFIERATRVAENITTGDVSHHDLDVHIGPLEAMIGESGTATYEHYLQQTSVGELWSRLWGHPQDTRKYLLFKNLLDIVGPLQGHVPPKFPLTLKFPLGEDGRMPAFDASFWMEVCMRVMRYPTVQASFFWTQPTEGSEARPFLLIALAPPSTEAFIHLMPIDVDSDTLCDLEQLGSQSAAQAALAIPSRYGELLEAEQMTLQDFLQHL